MNNSCNVMQDLFVPYLDETCSEESRAVLEQHLKECKSCRMAMETYQSPIPSVDVRANMQAEKPFKKIRRKIRFFIVAFVVLLILIFRLRCIRYTGIRIIFTRLIVFFSVLMTATFSTLPR